MNVLIVGVGSHREFGLKTLRAAGHRVGVVDQLNRISTHDVDWYAWADPRDHVSVIRALAESPCRWDALLCWDEMCVEEVPKVAAVLDVPAPNMITENFRDKSLMRQVLRKAGLLTPRYWAASSMEELHAIGVSEWPLVVKPVDYGGSSGVRLVHDWQELEQAFMQNVVKSPRRKCLIEEYVEGPEYSVETVTWRGGRHVTLGITKKYTTKPPCFVEVGHTFPAPLQADEEEMLISLTHRALDVLGMEAGASHLELKMTERGPVMIEVAGRLGGDFIPDLVTLSTEQNPYLCELHAITGEEVPERIAGVPGTVSSVHFFTAQEGRVIKWPSLHSLQEAELMRRTVREIQYWYPEGTAAPALHSNSKRLGYCLFHGTEEQVEAAKVSVTTLFSMAE